MLDALHVKAQVFGVGDGEAQEATTTKNVLIVKGLAIFLMNRSCLINDSSGTWLYFDLIGIGFTMSRVGE